MDFKNTLMWKELNEGPAILHDIAVKNAPVLSEIAAALKGKEISCVFTAARGTSDHAMLWFKYLTESTVGLPVASAAPSAATIYGGKMHLEHALVVGCSQSGKAADVLEIVRSGNACGAVTVAITNDETSPLAKEAKFHLFCCAGEEKSVAATKTFTAQLYVAALLAACLGGPKGDDDWSERLCKLVPAVDAATDNIAAAFGKAEECFVLSRGLSAAIAFECALKLQETCYIRARAYHSSDFYHGPMAMIGHGTKVILFASKHSITPETDGIHRADYVHCAQKMTELGADLYVITDDAEAFAGMPVNITEVPGGKNEEETSFVFALAVQMLACKVSCGRGLSPDAPRALKKVTVTR